MLNKIFFSFFCRFVCSIYRLPWLGVEHGDNWDTWDTHTHTQIHMGYGGLVWDYIKIKFFFNKNWYEYESVSFAAVAGCSTFLSYIYTLIGHFIEPRHSFVFVMTNGKYSKESNIKWSGKCSDEIMLLRFVYYAIFYKCRRSIWIIRKNMKIFLF